MALRLNVSCRLRKGWSDEVRDVAIEPRCTSALGLVSAGNADGAPEVRLSMLDYVRRYGTVMGMCMYELDGDWVPLRDRLAA